MCGAVAADTILPMLTAGHIELFVADPERARAFYEKVLGLEVVAVQSEGKVVWLRLGGLQLLVRPGTPPAGGARYQDASAALVLYTDGLEAARRDLAARGLVFRGDDGPGCPTFTDPDGHWFQLVDPRDHGA